MPRGGKREGAGRPKGSIGAAGKARRLIWNRPKDVPLVEFALSVINDRSQPESVRQHMAGMPFMRRASGVVIGVTTLPTKKP